MKSSTETFCVVQVADTELKGRAARGFTKSVCVAVLFGGG